MKEFRVTEVIFVVIFLDDVLTVFVKNGINHLYDMVGQVNMRYSFSDMFQSGYKKLNKYH